MDKIEQMRQQQGGNLKRYLAQAVEVAAEQYPDLAAALRATVPCLVSPSGAVSFYVNAHEYVCVPSLLTETEGAAPARRPAPSRHPSDYADHINDGGKGAGPIVSVFVDGKFLRVVEWDGGPTAYAFSYDAQTGMRAKSCRMAYRVGHTRKGFFIAPYSRRHYLLPPPGDTNTKEAIHDEA